jgi:hypothetical protein
MSREIYINEHGFLMELEKLSNPYHLKKILEKKYTNKQSTQKDNVKNQ